MVDENLNGALPPNGDGTSVSSGPVGLGELLGKELGKQFPDDQAALKAVKDTFSHVGQVGQYKSAVESAAAKKGMTPEAFMQSLVSEDPKVDTSKFVSREEFEEETFFAKNGDLAEHRALLKSISKAEGKPLVEAAQSESFQKLYTAAKAHAEAEKSKSVLQSNSRLGVITDKTKKAQEHLGNFRQTGDVRAFEAAKTEAVGAVLDLMQ